MDQHEAMTDERLAELRGYASKGLPLPPGPSGELLDEVDRMRAPGVVHVAYSWRTEHGAGWGSARMLSSSASVTQADIDAWLGALGEAMTDTHPGAHIVVIGWHALGPS